MQNQLVRFIPSFLLAQARMETWKIVPHKEVPFVLTGGKTIVKSVFEFLQRPEPSTDG